MSKAENVGRDLGVGDFTLTQEEVDALVAKIPRLWFAVWTDSMDETHVHDSIVTGGPNGATDDHWGQRLGEVVMQACERDVSLDPLRIAAAVAAHIVVNLRKPADAAVN